MFNVGDKIVFPMHGAGVIDSIEEKNILGEKQSYYILKMPGEVKVMVPTAKAEEIGVRNIIDKNTGKITKEITDNYDIIITESLNIKKMIMDKNINLSKKINDATFREILKQLEYKSKEKGKYFFKINTYYPSSQTCSVCDNIDKKYKNLNERDYVCQCCKNTLDRDLNASINIIFEGLKLYMKKVYSRYQ